MLDEQDKVSAKSIYPAFICRPLAQGSKTPQGAGTFLSIWRVPCFVLCQLQQFGCHLLLTLVFLTQVLLFSSGL